VARGSGRWRRAEWGAGTPCGWAMTAAVVTLALRGSRTPEGVDRTRGDDYYATTVPETTTPEAVSPV